MIRTTLGLIQLGAVCVVGVVLTASVALDLAVHRLSARGVTALEDLGAVVAVLLLGGAVTQAVFAFRDLRLQHADTNADDRRVLRQLAMAAGYRLAGKGLLAAALGLLALSRQTDVLHWLRGHPLSLFLLILDAMVLFTVLDVLELPFRAAFRAPRKPR